MILPGATLGLLGGGQLGRMFTTAARTLGYRVTVVDPDPVAPAAEFATSHIATAYTDPASLELLSQLALAGVTLPLVLLCTSRSDEPPRWPAEAAVTRVALQGLPG